MVDLYNKGPRAVIVTMPHQSVCVKVGRCTCSNGTPATVHVPARGAAKGLDDAVLLSPDVARFGLTVRKGAAPTKEPQKEPIRPAAFARAEEGKVRSGRRSTK